MPIHDQSYRRYAGRRDLAGQAWMVIARSGIRTILRKRLFLGLLILAWLPFVVGAVMAYLNANFPQFTLLSITAQRFRDFLDFQGVFVFFITVWVGAGLVANDKRANALQIYLSKPVTRLEYIVGKAATLAVFLLLVTWVPATLLLLLNVAFTGSFAFLRENFYLFPAVTVFACVQILLATSVMLAFSSLSKSSRYVAILYAGAYFFSHAVFGVVYAVTGSTRLSWISLPANLNQLGDIIFRLTPRYSTPRFLSVLVAAILVGGAVWVLERRIRGVEVVQ